MKKWLETIKAWQKKLSRMGVAVRPAKIFMLHDVTPGDKEFDLLSLQVITAAPVSMSQAERLLLYALIFSLRPNNYLEIGTLYGGSALIVAAAMKSAHDNGRIFCIDPAPQISSEHWQQLAARTTLIKGFSPDVLPQARAIAGTPFDFALVDGDHGYYQCLQDAEALLPLVSDGAYLLFHDCFNMRVTRAIDEFVRKHAGQLLDFGPLTRVITIEHVPGGESAAWGGMRLLQVRN